MGQPYSTAPQGILWGSPIAQPHMSSYGAAPQHNPTWVLMGQPHSTTPHGFLWGSPIAQPHMGSYGAAPQHGPTGVLMGQPHSPAPQGSRTHLRWGRGSSRTSWGGGGGGGTLCKATAPWGPFSSSERRRCVCLGSEVGGQRSGVRGRGSRVRPWGRGKGVAVPAAAARLLLPAARGRCELRGETIESALGCADFRGSPEEP